MQLETKPKNDVLNNKAIFDCLKASQYEICQNLTLLIGLGRQSAAIKPKSKRLVLLHQKRN